MTCASKPMLTRKISAELPGQGHDQPVEGVSVVGVGRAAWEGDVGRVAAALGLADLGRVTGAGVVGPLVERERPSLAAPFELVLRAVAVVDVRVEDRFSALPRRPGEQQPRPAMLLKTQNPIARLDSAWWPGGARGRDPNRPAGPRPSARGPPRPRPRRARRPSSRARRTCPGRGDLSGPRCGGASRLRTRGSDATSSSRVAARAGRIVAFCRSRPIGRGPPGRRRAARASR